MNQYVMSGAETTNVNPTRDHLRALALSFLFGTIQATKHPTLACVEFELSVDFGLSNLSALGTTYPTVQTMYDTTKQGINEFSDRPYPVRGNLVVVAEFGANIGASDGDFDNYLRYPVMKQTSGVTIPGFIKIGNSNSSRTDFYTPFGNADVAVYFEHPYPDEVFDKIMDTVGSVISQGTNTITQQNTLSRIG